MFCPHCGCKNNPNSAFCKECGFNLRKYKQDAYLRQRQSTTSGPNVTSSRLRRTQIPKHNHNFVTIIVSTILVAILLIIGIGAYTTNTWPFGNGNNGSSTSRVSSGINSTPTSNAGTSNRSNSAANKAHGSSDNQGVVTPIDELWSDVQSQANGGDGSLAKFFTTGTSNYGYKQVNGWSHDQTKVDDLSRVIVRPSLISKRISGSKAIVKYKVNYKFEYNNGKKKIQSFIWVAHMKQQNGKWLISSNNSSNKPVSDN